MRHIIQFLVLLLAGLLPLHGAVTVFLPAPVRYWKEAVLVILVLLWLIGEIQRLIVRKHLDWHWVQWCALFFILLTGFMALLHPVLDYSLQAWRYLAQGLVLFLVLSRWIYWAQISYTQFLQKFSTVLVFSTLVSVLFGLWSKFLGGAKHLSEFYATTISSWVPGQTLPVYHQVGDFVRMQGASSGPVAFGHIVFLAFFLVRYTAFRLWQKNLIRGILLFAMYQSASRAVMGAVVLLLLWELWRAVTSDGRKINLWGALPGFIILIIGGIIFQVPQKILARAGTNEHFSRPVEAFMLGMERPVLGNFAQIGPAKRAYNLHFHNDDRAPIAENVFVDVFAQTGIFGIILYMLVWAGIIMQTRKKAFVFLVFALAQFATLFDMMPLALLIWGTFAFLWNMNDNSMAHLSDTK